MNNSLLNIGLAALVAFLPIACRRVDNNNLVPGADGSADNDGGGARRGGTDALTVVDPSLGDASDGDPEWPLPRDGGRRPSPDGKNANDGGQTPDVAPSDAMTLRNDAGLVADAQPVPTPEPPPCAPPTDNAVVDIFSPGADLACDHPAATLPQFVAAVDDELFAASAACGTCIELSTTQGKVVAEVVESYSGAPKPSGHLVSLNKAAGDKLGNIGSGTIAAKLRRVPCSVTGDITAALTSQSDGYGWEFILRHYVNPVAKVEYAVGGQWKEVKRQSDNHFLQNPAPGLPEQLRLTDTFGNVRATSRLQWPTSPRTAELPLGVQFPAGCSH